MIRCAARYLIKEILETGERCILIATLRFQLEGRGLGARVLIRICELLGILREVLGGDGGVTGCLRLEGMRFRDGLFAFRQVLIGE